MIMMMVLMMEVNLIGAMGGGQGSGQTQLGRNIGISDTKK